MAKKLDLGHSKFTLGEANYQPMLTKEEKNLEETVKVGGEISAENQYIVHINEKEGEITKDLIHTPPSDDPYSPLKSSLLRMYSLTDYAHYKAINSLPFSGDMLPSALMSKMLSLLPSGHRTCFFLRGAFLKRLPTDVRSHLVHDSSSDPLTLALCADKIHQSRVSFASAVNQVHSTSEDCPVLAIRAPPVSSGRSQCSPTPCPYQSCPSAPPSASRWSDLPDLCWYYCNHADRA